MTPEEKDASRALLVMIGCGVLAVKIGIATLVVVALLKFIF